MVTTTPNLGLNKPAINDPTDEDLWGGQWNTNADIEDSEAATKTVDLDFNDKVLSKAEVKDLSEDTHDLGSTSGALAVDYTNGHFQFVTLTGNITSVTISNFPVSGKVGFISIEFTQDATGSRTLSLSSAYRTVNNTPVTLTTTANAVDIVRFETRDAGTTINAFLNENMS